MKVEPERASNIDVEAGPLPVTRSRKFRFLQWGRLSGLLSTPKADSSDSAAGNSPKTGKLEGYPKGYGRYAALMGRHPSFHVFRRFTWLRMRLILREQGELAHLERRLKRLDKGEKNEYFLKSVVHDKNRQRSEVFTQIREHMDRLGLTVMRCSKLIHTDQLLLNSTQILSSREANRHDVRSLQHWIDGNDCIVEQETSFLTKDDLSVLVRPSDEGREIFHRVTESFLIKFNKMLRKNNPENDFTDDKHVHIFRDSKISGCASATLISLSVGLLLIPIIILHYVKLTWVRLLILFVSVAVFATAMSLFTHARVSELLAGTAGYAAVLVVFLSGTS